MPCARGVKKLDDFYIIVGLGNPGKEYINTRHNLGFEVVDMLSGEYGIKVSKLKFRSYLGFGKINAKKVILVKPMTYMNLSGESVREIIEWYKTEKENDSYKNLIVIYDDIDLPTGKIRVRPDGSSGTHNGMKSIIYQLQTEDFARIRIGIGRPPEGWELSNYVLGKIGSDERSIVNESIQRAAKAVVTIMESGIETAMSLYNG